MERPKKWKQVAAGLTAFGTLALGACGDVNSGTPPETSPGTERTTEAAQDDGLTDGDSGTGSKGQAAERKQTGDVTKSKYTDEEKQQLIDAYIDEERKMSPDLVLHPDVPFVEYDSGTAVEFTFRRTPDGPWSGGHGTYDQLNDMFFNGKLGQSEDSCILDNPCAIILPGN